jgi:methionine aminopeptidase
MTVTIKTADEQDKMRVAGRLAADVLDMIGDYVKPGVTTGELDRICHESRPPSTTGAFRSRSAHPSTMSSVTAFPATAN